MLEFFKKNNFKNKGSLTVETTIVLPIVIITLLFVINIMNIYMVHTCMQQALNNTAKTISHYSYLVYRLDKDKENFDIYTEFLDKISNDKDGNKTFVGKTLNEIDTYLNNAEPEEAWKKMTKEVGDIKNAVKLASTSIANMSNNFLGIWKAFDKYEFLENEPGLNKRLENFDTSIKNTATSSIAVLSSVTDLVDKILKFPANEAENVKSLFWNLVGSELASGAADLIITRTFIDYAKKLNIPASKIKDLNAQQTQINSDGSITLAVSYTYVNPFSFVNNEKLGFSPLNKEIRMFQSITVRPFVGRSGTSLPKAKSTGTTVWITKTGRCYHSKKNCRNTDPDNAKEISLFEAKYKYSACRNCWDKDGKPK